MKDKIKLSKENLGIYLILILSAVLNFANLGIEGNANTYYSAGVKSMMMNLKNFFFVSSDPSGFVTIDKPPIGFWLQTISAKIFGFSGWSVILPQALAGVISVWLIYYIVKRSFGNLAGLVSALCLAVTPIFVAASRNNTIDNLLVLSLLMACLAISYAAEKGKLKYLILSIVLIGIGFNIKMVEAYMVAPAVFITYFFSSALSYKKKTKHLIIGLVVLLGVSLSWAIVVDLVPSSDRPFIGSSTNNSVMELIVGHNGLQRVGIGSKYISRGGKNKTNKKNLNILQNNSYNKYRKTQNNKNNNQYKMQNNSNTGIARLFYYNNLSDQISWLLPFAIIGFIVAAVEEKFKLPFNNKRKLDLLLWVTWLIPEFIYFSFSKNITHTYYLTTMAPAIAALTGIGLDAMWKLYSKGEWKKWILPFAFVINGIVEMSMLYYNYKKSYDYKITFVVTVVLCIGASISLIIRIVFGKNNNFELGKKSARKLNTVFVAAAFIGILTAPTVWSFATLFYPMNSSSPSAGLELASSKENRSFNNSSNEKLIQFLQKNKKNKKYLVAVPSAMNYASDLILKTGQPVMTIGGFSGSDKIITLEEFKQVVSKGELRYVIVNSGTGIIGGQNKENPNNDIMNWVKSNGKLVPDNQWNDSSTLKISNNKKTRNNMSSAKLYDLSGITQF
ncbi:MAG: glycosyltransferase family 39 protein [Clostridium sp.]|nr:glycosyltransferase family 39 protein [Clostridium sp.]